MYIHDLSKKFSVSKQTLKNFSILAHLLSAADKHDTHSILLAWVIDLIIEHFEINVLPK